MSRAKAYRTWTIGDERLTAALHDHGLVITTMDRGTVEHPGPRFGVYEHITIPAVFVPALRAMLLSLPGRGGSRAACPMCGLPAGDVTPALCPEHPQ